MKNRKFRIVLAIYILWAFVHLIFLFIGWNGGKYHSTFWPFESSDISTAIEDIKYNYDFSEFLVYAATPFVIFVVYKLIRKAT